MLNGQYTIVLLTLFAAAVTATMQCTTLFPQLKVSPKLINTLKSLAHINNFVLMKWLGI